MPSKRLQARAVERALRGVKSCGEKVGNNRPCNREAHWQRQRTRPTMERMTLYPQCYKHAVQGRDDNPYYVWMVHLPTRTMMYIKDANLIEWMKRQEAACHSSQA
jgi:hypothetical protein